MNRLQAIDYMVQLLELLCLNNGISRERLLELRKFVEEKK